MYLIDTVTHELNALVYSAALCYQLQILCLPIMFTPGDLSFPPFQTSCAT